jgi:hypothetical protein
VAAWRDFKVFRDSDSDADQLASFVETHFSGLRAIPLNRDLLVTNQLGEELNVRRLPRTGHGGFSSMEGSEQFQVSSVAALLEVGGGMKRNFEGLVKQLASFNKQPSE